MLKFLTHKLRTHSLNEDHPHYDKAEDDHDSGTESDDEQGEAEDQESVMESEADRSSGSTVSPFQGTVTACSPYFLDSALPSDCGDQHSSEEELEVINCASAPLPPPPARAVSSHSVAAAPTSLPEKRKWSQTASCPLLPAAAESSSDEEVQGLLGAGAPVQFRTSPPVDAHKPGRSPPPKLFHYAAAAAADASPRKRHRHTPRAHNIPRPCLDFEKMQQLKARAVTTWRHSGDHGGELSVYCW